jgi:pimeloyl-ACP methyl ester carboxylesterase
MCGQSELCEPCRGAGAGASVQSVSDVPAATAVDAGGDGGGDESIRRHDGRRLAFREYGAPDGAPMFYFHGWPGSRLDFAVNDASAAAADVRVIAVDRPGIAGSDHQRGRRVLDWPAEVAALADARGIDRFAVLGFSFGGPYARACAHALGDRVTRAILVSSVGPLDDPAAGLALLPRPLRTTLALARFAPPLALPFAWQNARAARDAPPGELPAADSIPATDREVLSRADVFDCLSASAAECFRRGTRGPAWDAVALARGEGFRLEEISTEVQIWHGELDRSDPVAMARSQERRLANAQARYVADGGHLILFSHATEILAGVHG